MGTLLQSNSLQKIGVTLMSAWRSGIPNDSRTDDLGSNPSRTQESAKMPMLFVIVVCTYMK
jgi:hypothetical protein